MSRAPYVYVVMQDGIPLRGFTIKYECNRYLKDRVGPPVQVYRFPPYDPDRTYVWNNPDQI